MAKGPKDVLPENGRTAAEWQEEMPLELPINQDHGQPGVQYRQRYQDEKRVDKIHPGKERQASHCHAWPATGDHGGDGVNRETNRAETQDKERYRPIIDPGR